MKGVYLAQSENILYHDWEQLVTFVTAQSLNNNNKPLFSYGQREQGGSGENLIYHRVLGENSEKKKIDDGLCFLSKKLKVVRQEREKIELYNDVITHEIGSVQAKRRSK